MAPSQFRNAPLFSDEKSPGHAGPSFLCTTTTGFKLATSAPSGTFGIPVASENRTVAGMGLPLNNTAQLSPAASGDALKLPSTTMPLA